MKPNAAETALKLPVGIRDLRVNATTAADADMQVLDPSTQTYVVHNGKLIASSVGGMQVEYADRAGMPPAQALHISEVTSHLILKFHNRASRWRTVTLSFSFQGVSPCPEVPAGCAQYDEAAAWNEVSAWSSWVQSKFANAGVAWQALAADLQEGQQSAGVPWYRFGAVWDRWGMESSSTSWQKAFALLDADGDEHISLEEFTTGYRLAAPGGGAGFFIPAWTIWALPLLAVGCLGARFAAREATRKPQYLNVDEGRGLHESTTPFRFPTDTGAAANASQASFSSRLADTWNDLRDTRSYRGCNTGFEKLGLMECGLRGSKDKATPGRPQCSKCGWSCRCPNCSRDTRVLPPVLAWRGPDESVEEDEIQALIRDMKADPLNTSLQESSCARLEQLALGPTSKKKIASSGGVEAITAAMQGHPFDAHVQEHACGALGNLALRSEENQQKIGKEKGVERVLKAMADHPTSPNLQERGAWALEQLGMTSKSRAEIVSGGGIERVVGSMKANPGSEAVQEHGCMALGNMAYDADHRKQIAHGGGVEAIVAAMRAFPSAPALQEDACFALHNMACSDEAMKPIAEAGGIEAALEAMREHPQVPGVQENAINALHNVNCGSLTYVHKVANANGIPLIVQAMHSHSVPSLQAKACHVLGQLGDRDDDVRAQVERAGGVEAIELAKSTFKSSKEVQQEAREALKILKDV